ncbi:hypothetical protein DPSP01_004039 [Paraphaeosphaeria sporulosa]
MVFITPQRTLLLFLAVGIFQTNAFPADGAPNSLLPTFRLVEGDGGSETGRCTGADLDNLKASYEDMCAMARHARDDIDYLMQEADKTGGAGPPKPESKDAPQADIENWQRWNRVRATYLSLFGKDPFIDTTQPRAGKPVLGHKTFVRDFYNRVDTEFCVGQNSNSPLAVCTDAHFKFVKIGEVDPGDSQGRTIENTQPQCRNIGGVWYSPNMPEADRYGFFPPPNKPGDGPYCADPDDLASTHPDRGFIVFCKNGLDGKGHNLVTLEDQRANIKPTSKRYKKSANRERFLQLLGVGGLTKLEDIKGDGGQNMPVTWLHEMHHLLKNSDDERAVDKNGKHIKTTRRIFNVETQKYEKQEDEERAYGYALARDLALYGGLSAMINPENSAFFALAMFFSEYDWSRGFAMPLMDPFQSDE